MTGSVRHDILKQIVATYAAFALPGEPPFFSVVALGPLSDTDQRKRYSIGVVQGQEREKFIYPWIECMLTVNIEFRVTVNRDDASPGDMAEGLLTQVKKLVMSNRSWGGRALDTKVIGNEIDLTTYGDRSVIGVLVCEVQFRHSHLDPANPNPDP